MTTLVHDGVHASERPMDQAQSLRDAAATRRALKPLRVVSVVSGKGGVGKTYASTSMAVLAAQRGRRVLLLDADLGLANVEIVLGVRPRYHVGDLLEKGLSIHEVLATGPHGIRILAGGSGFTNLTNLDDEAKRFLLNALEPLEETFDTVIIDAGAGIGENVMFFASASQETVLVLNDEPTALTDAYATVKVLSQQAGVKRFEVLINNVSSEVEARKVYGALSSVTDKFLDARLHYLGSIPTDDAVKQAVMSQSPAVDLFPNASSTRALRGITESFFDSPPKNEDLGGMKFLWRRLMRNEHVA